MAIRSCSEIILQLKDILVVLRNPGVASPGSKGSLNRNRWREVGGRLIVSDPAPLKMGFVQDPRVYHHRIAHLDGILLIVQVECLFRQVELTRTIRGCDGTRV